jgi:phosphatidate cytidylyltransferase
MNNLLTRSLTGLIFIVLMVGGILGGAITATLLYSVIVALAIWEFGRCLDHSSTFFVNGSLSILLSIYLIAFTGFFASGFLDFEACNLECFGGLVLALIVVIMVNALSHHIAQGYSNWVNALVSQMYITLPFCVLLYLSFRRAEGEDMVYDATIPLAIFVILWANDTGAYCSGSLLHRYFPAKLAPAISPAKTWVGTIGGTTLCLVVGGIFAAVTPVFSLPFWLGLAAVVSIFGTLGDLLESRFKRTLGLKDSGHLLPGHGGILDRFDSALLAIPAAGAYILLLRTFKELLEF